MERGANAPAESEAAAQSDAQSDAQRAQDFLQAQQHYYRQLRTHRQDLAKFKESRREHLAAVEMLGELPEKTRHGIMVPLGKMAFVPGELIHTNEVLVLLGDNYFAERSACQAAEIMQRRIEVIDRVISTTEKNIKDLAARSNFSQEARQALLRKMEIDTVGGPPAVPAEVEERADEDDDDEGLVHCCKLLDAHAYPRNFRVPKLAFFHATRVCLDGAHACGVDRVRTSGTR